VADEDIVRSVEDMALVVDVLSAESSVLLDLTVWLDGRGRNVVLDSLRDDVKACKVSSTSETERIQH
jgi:hypothetical protein